MPKSKNEYLYPIDPRNIARISYDESPAHIEKLKHAVDFICNEGTPVRAALDGTVVDVKQDSELGGENKSFDLVGNYIEIKHANGEYSICEHIQKNGSLVKIGDKIKAGQKIGLSGKTGWIAHLGAHLHFDVHVYFAQSNDYQTVEIRWKK